jgi:RibD C-terminal domain
MQELLVDFITSLDGYGAAEGWPGFWGLQGPEYLAWLGEQPERDYTILMGANTYRLMSGFADEAETLEADEAAAVDELAGTPKVVFSSTPQPPSAWANTPVIGGDAVEAVAGTVPLVAAGFADSPFPPDEAGRRRPDAHARQPHPVPYLHPNAREPHHCPLRRRAPRAASRPRRSRFGIVRCPGVPPVGERGLASPLVGG